MSATDEGTTTTEDFVVVWFPPDVEQRERSFADEDKARRFAASEQVAPWHPLLVERTTTKTVTSEIVPL